MRTLYLHGFLSSPSSNKATKLREAHQKAGIKFSAPELHVGPKAAAEIILRTIESFDGEDFCVIGSSLGGFYSTWVAENFSTRAILLNPAVRPWNFMDGKEGEHFVEGTNKKIIVYPQYKEELQTMATDKPSNPKNYLVFLADADEVLNWKDGAEFYSQCRQIIVKGADHRFSEFDSLVPEIMDFVRRQ